MALTTEPTDAGILDAADDFRSQYKHGGTTFDEFDALGFARAVLAKWGTPQPTQARDALGLVPQPAGALGPDGKEWAKTAAGYQHVDSMVPSADGHERGPYWYGWALRGAFVAGAEWQEARNLTAERATKEGAS